jgi:hypothetical protein
VTLRFRLRVVVPLLLLIVGAFGMQAAPAAASVSPAGGRITWDVNGGFCFPSSMKAHAIMTVNDTAGVNWMKITLSLQTYYGGYWHIRQTYSVYNRYYFTPGGYHYIQSTHSFRYHGPDFSHPTIIRGDFYWKHNGATWYHHYDQTGECR